MSWYYAENNDRRGPIDDAQFDGLVSRGAIRPDTLVWREGFANWVPLRESGHLPSGAATATATATAAAPGTAEEMGVCSESGRILPRSELVEINGRLVSAEYKNVVLQRIREGVAAGGAAADPEALALAIEQRGYQLSIRNCIGRGWDLVKNRFWLTVGATFLTMMVSQAAGMIPLIGPFLVFGPLTAGMYWIMILLLRKEPAGIGDAFVGFSRGFGHLLGFTAVLFGSILLCMVPGGFVMGLGAAFSSGDSVAGQGLIGVGALLIFAAIFVMMYLWTSWIFGLPLIVDKQIEFWPAMKLSKRVVGLHWWKVFGVLFCTGLVIMGILLCLGALIAVVFGILAGVNASEGVIVSAAILFGGIFVFGLLALMPLSYATVAVAYEEIFGPQGAR